MVNQTLSSPLPDIISVGGRNYKINLAFNRVLNVLDLLKDDNWEVSEAYDIVFDWLLENPNRKAGISERVAVVEAIFNQFLLSEDKKNDKSPPVLSFTQDAKYIYAAFREAYNINLFAEQDKLQWWEFTSLLSSLPSETRLAQIIKIRSQKIPVPNGKNAAEIDRICKLKAQYAIRENTPYSNSQQGLSDIFDALKKQATGKR